MAEVLLFHHAQGLTEGCIAFADDLRAAGHTVHTPDLYEGKTFAELDAGLEYAQEVGFGTVIERGRQAAESLPSEIVYAGFSLGVMPAQLLAQTRPGAKGALLMQSAAATSEFESDWPPDVPLQIHTNDAGEWGDVEIAQELADSIESAELFLYPTHRHLFADSSLSDYEAGSANLLKQRVLDFLERLG